MCKGKEKTITRRINKNHPPLMIISTTASKSNNPQGRRMGELILKEFIPPDSGNLTQCMNKLTQINSRIHLSRDILEKNLLRRNLFTDSLSTGFNNRLLIPFSGKN